MSVIATESTRFSGVVKYEQRPDIGICRESIVINDVAATLKVGTVLGKVTATGKYKVSLSAASDGSQTPAAVLIADVNGLSGDIVLPANTDVKALVLARGDAIVAGEALTIGTGHTIASVKAAFLLINNPIIVESQL